MIVRVVALAALVLTVGMIGTVQQNVQQNADTIHTEERRENVHQNVRRDTLKFGFDLLLWAASVRAQAVAGEGALGAVSVEPFWDRASDVVPEGHRSVQDWRALICAPQWDWPCWWITDLIACESGGNPNAVNWAGPYYGLVQVLNGSTDPMTNLLQGHQQFKDWMAGVRQTSPWPGCSPERPVEP